MEREIKLYGPLAKFVGQRRFLAEVNSAGEAIKMLLVNFPGLEQHMAEWHYKVIVDDYESDLEEIHNPVSGCIQIVPVVAGAGFWGTLGKIFAGVALVATALFLGPSAAIGGAGLFGATFGAGVIGGVAATAIGTVGIALALGGVAQLLSPTPQIGSLGPANAFKPATSTEGSQLDPQSQDSYSFSGIQNTSAASTAVPLVYGETVVGSVTISAGLDVDTK